MEKELILVPLQNQHESLSLCIPATVPPDKIGQESRAASYLSGEEKPVA